MLQSLTRYGVCSSKLNLESQLGFTYVRIYSRRSGVILVSAYVGCDL